MKPRALAPKLRALAATFPAVYLGGPRQSGKTTLARATFPSHPYVSLEDPDQRESAATDPRGFLARFPEGAVLDEVQRVPSILSYLQGIIDAHRTPGRFILTGSQQFLLMRNVSQSLAGRLIPVEMKSGATIAGDAFAGLRYWLALPGNLERRDVLVYGGGEQPQTREEHVARPWFACS